MELSVEQAPLSVTVNRKGINTLTKKQWQTLICLAAGNVGIATCSALQAPFFPREAEMKGTTPSQYGLVFGLFYLTNFFFSPIFGRVMRIVTPEFLRDAGMFVVGVCFILFGFLDKSPPGRTFLALAYIIRIAEGIGSTAFKTSNFAIIVVSFPDHTATALGTLETMYGLGLILGPSIGSALFEMGGYYLPFVSSGICLLIIGTVTFFLLPKLDDIPLPKEKTITYGQFLKNPLVLLHVSLLMWASICLGFNMATLEPHLRQFNLSPIGVGAVFIIGGSIYAFTSPIWGYLADNRFNPKMLSLLASLSIAIAYTFIGPSVIFSFKSKLWLVIVSLGMFGNGFGGTRVIAYVDCLQDAVNIGLPNDVSTGGVISGTFTAVYAIGFFIGPTFGGILLENIGYNLSSSILATAMYIQAFGFLIYICWERSRAKKTKQILLKNNSHLLKGYRSATSELE